ncbi:MAG: hypothetical protein Q8O51_02790 [bacterium]|nr:hypothetical protein [bacterium]
MSLKFPALFRNLKGRRDPASRRDKRRPGTELVLALVLTAAAIGLVLLLSPASIAGAR